MIKPSELRIGNRVTVKDNNNAGRVVVTVERVFPDGCQVSFNSELQNVTADEMDGVDLNRARLALIGFKSSHPGEVYDFGDMPYLFLSITEEGYHLTMGEGRVTQEPIRHLHRLQNLYFSLTGREMVLIDLPPKEN